MRLRLNTMTAGGTGKETYDANKLRVWQVKTFRVAKTSHSRFSLLLPVSHARRPMILFDANYPRQGFDPPPALKRGDSARVADSVLNRIAIQKTSGLGSQLNIRAGRLVARTGILD